MKVIPAPRQTLIVRFAVAIATVMFSATTPATTSVELTRISNQPSSDGKLQVSVAPSSLITRPSKKQKLAMDEVERQRAIARDTEIARLILEFDKAQRAGDVEAAAHSFGELKQVLPQTQFAYMRRAAWLAQVSGDSIEARQWYGRVLARLPDDLNAQLNLALLDAKDGMKVQALERVRNMKFLYPGATSVDRLLDLIEGR